MNFLKQRRQELGLSQKDIAERIGLTRTTVWQFEKEGSAKFAQLENILGAYELRIVGSSSVDMLIKELEDVVSCQLGQECKVSIKFEVKGVE